MLRSAQLRLIALGAIAAALAACAGDTTAPGFTLSDTQISQDVAADAGDAMASTSDVIVSSEATYDGGSADVVGDAAAMPSTNCSGPNASGWYTCATTTERGLSVTRALRFWEGTNFGLWFTARTDSVNHALNVDGTVTPSATKTIWVKRLDSLTMKVTRGASPTRTWNGHGSRADSSTATDNGTTKKYHYTATGLVTNVVFNVPRSANPYPASGTIAHDATVVLSATNGTRTFDKTTTRHAVVTFNGTKDVTLQVGELTCSLDLSTHKVTGCH